MSTPGLDAAVVGGGPAGAAAALTLAQAGRDVLLVEQATDEAFKIGEGLPPAAGPLLRTLGVFAAFCADGHLPSYGNASAWGSPALHGTDFIRDPHGHGWHLDRPRFDARLRAAAAEAGAVLRTATALRHVERGPDDAWRLHLDGPHDAEPLRCAWLLDCTGRPSHVARRLGARRRKADRLIAFYALFHPPAHPAEADADATTLVESVPEGWWYTGLLPAGRRVVVFFTDAGLASARAAQTRDGFLSLLAGTRHIRERLHRYAFTMDGTPQGTGARTARLDAFHGAGWLAAGDAALSFDPLSSQGILTALYAGLKAGRALLAHLAGDADALARYDHDLETVFRHYLRHRTDYYRSEQRWPEHPFWKTRR